jgi:hypothetical protein
MPKCPVIAGLLLLCLSAASLAQEPPDFSGIWMPDRSPGYNAKAFPRANWPYTALGQQLQDSYVAAFDPVKDDPAFFCVPPGMPMSMSPAAPFPLEIIQRDQDLTLFFEAWSQYRKIYLDGHDRPEPLLNSRMGYSVAHWEGEVLVIETSYLAGQTMGRSLMSEQAGFTERLHLETGADGKRRLISDIEFRDPAIYTETIPVRGVWIEAPDTAIMEYVCTDEIYSQHLERARATKQ